MKKEYLKKFEMTLDKFLKLSPIKNYFIYDQQAKNAYFSTQQEGNQVGENVNLKLCVVNPFSTFLQSESCSYETPVLKSNLQKAIRRCKTEVAVSTAKLLFHSSPLELFRRLPIIMIEDVALMESISILVWYMLAFGHYKLKQEDEFVILQIVNQLATEKSYFEFDKKTFTIRNPSNLNHFTLSLYHRKQFGGMKGDMKLIDEAIDYYHRNPDKVIKSNFNQEIKLNFKLLHCAIDFHCYPWMLNKISQWSKLKEDKIKELIWFACSGKNIRKSKTIDLSQEYKSMEEWKMIKPKLYYLRRKLSS